MTEVLTEDHLKKMGFVDDALSYFTQPNDYYGRNYILYIPNSNAYFEYDVADNSMWCASSDGGDTSTVKENVRDLEDMKRLYEAISDQTIDITK